MNIFQNIATTISGQNVNKKKIKGNVVLLKKNVLDFTSLESAVLDPLGELLGQGVSLQLVSAVHGDPNQNGLPGKIGKPAYLENWITTLTSITVGESAYDVNFEWDEEIGIPGAFIIKNAHQTEFFLKTLTLADVPGHGRMHFVCNSWVYPTQRYQTDRIFFTNETYLPSETPAPIQHYRAKELATLRGNGTGKREEWDRIYDYDIYNDLGNKLPIFGGSSEYPYPRRGRTGRPKSSADPRYESRLPLIMGLNIYVPRDERFGHLKMADFLTYGLKAIVQFLLPEFEALRDSTPNEFDTFQDVLDLYEGGIKLPTGPIFDAIRQAIPLEMLRELFRTDGEGLMKFPLPQVIQHDTSAWRTDEEFAREMLAGVNPVSIQRLHEFPPTSKLDPKVYGNQNSSITKDHIESNLGGLSVDKALKTNRLFILDHHDIFMPYLTRINTTSRKCYATRTLLFLQDDGTLKPVAIELSVPSPQGNQFGAIKQVFTPTEDGVAGSIWQLAKAFVAVNDSGVHQLVSHWLNTHATIEPFVLATNRHLSVVHPIYKLLQPHYRDTMNINASARQLLINSGGIIERIFSPATFSTEMSSVAYKNWVFTEQALPADLIKRGMAVEDSNSPHGIRLLIEDYPYAVDGLKIWSAIKTWVEDYCNLYYKNDESLQKDTEVQAFWKEVREVGHGDKKNEPWWPKMQTIKDLVNSCTTIIWIASALHAAVNFGQYPYAGYHPNRPTLSRRFIPEPGTREYEELKSNPEKGFLRTMTSQLQTLIGISVVEILSRHASDEVFLGQRATPEWTKDDATLEAFRKFGKVLDGIEKEIVEMNKDKKWKNRVGPVNVDYTLLYPTSGEGLTGKGIPNSVSI